MSAGPDAFCCPYTVWASSFQTNGYLAVQVTGYVQHFNLSISLATNISKFSAWVSSGLLVTLLLATTSFQKRSATGLLDLPRALTAAQSSLVAVSVAAAVLLIASVPLAGKLAQAARKKQPQIKSNGMQQRADLVVSSPQQQGTLASDQVLQPALVDAETDSHGSDSSSESAVILTSQKDDDRTTTQAANSDLSTQEADADMEDASLPQQLPSGSDSASQGKTDSTKRGGFFRDVSADCFPRLRLRCRHRHRSHGHRGLGPSRHAKCSRSTCMTILKGKSLSWLGL